MKQKYSIEQKLEVIDELINEYRDCTSLWSIKKQLTAIKAEKEKQTENEEVVTVGSLNSSCVGLPKFEKLCWALTATQEYRRAVLTIGENGAEWHDLRDERVITEPVLKWAYIKRGSK